jgi:hypothetical protein
MDLPDASAVEAAKRRRLPPARRDVDVVGEWHSDGFLVRVEEDDESVVKARDPCDLVAWR